MGRKGLHDSSEGPRMWVSRLQGLESGNLIIINNLILIGLHDSGSM